MSKNESRKTGPKFLPEQRLFIEQTAWEWRVKKRWSYTKIAEELFAQFGFQVDQSTIARAIKRAAERVEQEMTKFIGQVKADQTARLEHIYVEAIEAWERSKQPFNSVTQVQEMIRPVEGDPETSPKLMNEKITRTVKENVGASTFLEEARSALADIRNIWGIGKAGVEVNINIWQAEYIEAIQKGEVDYESLSEVLGDGSLAAELFARAGKAQVATGEGQKENTG